MSTAPTLAACIDRWLGAGIDDLPPAERSAEIEMLAEELIDAAEADGVDLPAEPFAALLAQI